MTKKKESYLQVRETPEMKALLKQAAEIESEKLGIDISVAQYVRRLYTQDLKSRGLLSG